MQISNLQLKSKNFLGSILIIGFAVALRLLPHPANVAPIAALALFGGFYLNKKYALIVPLIALFISDIFIGFHDTMLFVYGSFLLTGVIGLLCRPYRSFKTILLATLASSLLFFIITNFGVWMVSSMYPKTFDGLLQSYYFALPFFRNTILGDLLYTGLFIGSYEVLLRAFHLKEPALKKT